MRHFSRKGLCYAIATIAGFAPIMRWLEQLGPPEKEPVGAAIQGIETWDDGSEARLMQLKECSEAIKEIREEWIAVWGRKSN